MSTNLPAAKNSTTIVTVLTLLVAFFCDVKTINSFLTSGIDTDAETSGPMAMLYLFSIVGIFVLGFLHRPRGSIHIPGIATFVLMTVSVLYFLTWFLIAPPYTSVLFFGVFTLASFLMPFVAQIDARLFLKSLMLFATPAIFSLDRVFRFATEYSDTITMGLSYAFLVPVLASIVYMFLFFREERGWRRFVTIAGFVINMIFAFFLVSYGSRGPVFSMFALLAFLLVIQPDKSGRGVRVKKGRSLLLAVIVVLVAFAFVPLLLYLQENLSEQGLSFNFINKFIRMDESGDITNGREIILATSWDDILQSPFWGYGLDGFAHKHINIGAYPHNFIVQMLYDGGLLLFFLLLVPFAKGLLRVFKHCTVQEYGVYTALIFGSIPPALFSGDLWRAGTLWLLFGALLSHTFINNNNTIRR